MTNITLENTEIVIGDDLLRIGDIGRCELIDGRIVAKSPVGDNHAFVEFNLGAELRAFGRQHNVGRVLGGEVGLYIRRNPDRIRDADVIFISKETVAAAHRAIAGSRFVRRLPIISRLALLKSGLLSLNCGKFSFIVQRRISKNFKKQMN